MRILCMLQATRGGYPPEAADGRLALMRSYTTPATQIDADYMPAVSGFSPWGGTSPARHLHHAIHHAVQGIYNTRRHDKADL